MPEDAKEKLTRWITTGLPEPEGTVHLDRTRVMFKGQKEWYHACLALDDEYFTERVEKDMALMMAYKGRRSDDVVDVLSHFTDKDQRTGGVQPIEQHLRTRTAERRQA